MLELAGGLTGSGELNAVLMGGAAGSFVDRSYLDMPITLEDARERGTTLGSGVVMAFTDEIDLVDVLAVAPGRGGQKFRADEAELLRARADRKRQAKEARRAEKRLSLVHI